MSIFPSKMSAAKTDSSHAESVACPALELADAFHSDLGAPSPVGGWRHPRFFFVNRHHVG